jgi:mono/diheme cytochrome c family protein
MNDNRTERRVRSPLRVLAATTLGIVSLILSVSGHTWQGEANANSLAEGAELFKTHCASCHGADATGNGPVAAALRHRPADLTRIAKKNGGMFPTARVQRIIAGWDIESHGDRDMPVWGDPFTLTRDGRSRQGAEARIAAIVGYLESVQHRETH